MTDLPHSPFLGCLRQAATRAGILESANFQLSPGRLTITDSEDPEISIHLTVTNSQAGEVVANKSAAREWVMFIDNLLQKQRSASREDDHEG